VADRRPDTGREPVSILLAEHEPEVAEMSARYLHREGLRVRLVTDPEPTLAELTGGPAAAAVLDLTMPGLDPRRIRRALRTPVIFMVANGSAPRPRGLAVRGDAAGARRWLARPFSPRQLVTLAREVLAGGSDSPALPGVLARRSLAGSGLDAASQTAVAGGRRVSLTATEFAVLTVMLDHHGRVVSRRQLLTAIGRQTTGDRAADVYIAQLRAKLGPAWQIRTVRGAGYALNR
jgi:two-component system, OmpR family, response regulator MprA